MVLKIALMNSSVGLRIWWLYCKLLFECAKDNTFHFIILQEVTLVPTPVPTPEPILKEPLSPVRTPDLSEHPSALSLEENQPQELTSPGLPYHTFYE